MTAGSLAGIASLNLLFLVSGAGVLWALRGWSAWSELLRLLGVAYLLGVATVGLIAAELLAVGATLSVGLIVGVSAVVTAAGLAAGRLLGRRRPPLASGRARPEPYLAVGVLAAAISVVTLEAFFRVARLQPVVGWDVWAAWGQKGKAIYFFGGLDEQLFRGLPGATYPVLVPALEGMAFFLMGAPDTVTLHLQFWFLLAGMTTAVAGLLRPQVPLVLVWPFLALMLVMPDLLRNALNPQADWPLHFFFAPAALCVALWVLRDEGWLLPVAAIFLAAAMSTKREGLLLALCLLVAACVVTWGRRRQAWPRLLAVGAGAFVATIPWRLWYGARDLRAEWTPSGPGRLLEDLERLPPSLREMLELLLDYDRWLLVAPLGVAAAAVALLAGRRALPLLYLLTLGLAIVVLAVVLWAHPGVPTDTWALSPMPRVVASLVLLSVAFAPLLLAQALERGEPS
jgi:hypothetical protein